MKTFSTFDDKLAGTLVCYDPFHENSQDRTSLPQAKSIGIILERFIRANDGYKEEYYVVWFPSWQGKYISQPACAILSLEELTLYD